MKLQPSNLRRESKAESQSSVEKIFVNMLLYDNGSQQMMSALNQSEGPPELEKSAGVSRAAASTYDHEAVFSVVWYITEK